MLVSDRRRARGRDPVRVVGEAVRGGVALVQVREPDLRDDELRDHVLRIRDAAGPGVTLLVNGRPPVARSIGCGLHLPAAAPPLARPGLAPGAPYGRSVHDGDELETALRDGVDYVVAGTVFTTDSKPGRPPAGPALIELLCRLAHSLPIYAIGGITVARIPPLVHSGAWGVAVSGAILTSNDPRRVAEAMNLALAVARRD